VYKVKDFISWALTHVNPYTVPHDVVLSRPWNECGTEPWQYLFGSVRVKTTQATLDRYYEEHYSINGYSRARFDELTANWDRNGYATDCQGLCDAYLTYECGEKTDINADMNYRLWCTDKGRIEDINRGWVIGEAVFRANAAGKMKHIGWVCGMDGSEPLIVEAKGIAYGVIVTRLYDGKWTHRGLMTKKFDYTEEPSMIKFEVTVPMHIGMEYAKMQDVLNAAGFTDDAGNALESDGKWGKKSQQAFDKFIASYARKPEPLEVFNGEGKYRLVLEYK
jgi:hypothetical protein